MESSLRYVWDRAEHPFSACGVDILVNFVENVVVLMGMDKLLSVGIANGVSSFGWWAQLELLWSCYL